MGNNLPEYTEYKQILKEKLTEKRYYHSLCVADEAARLAEKYGADVEKCCLAGLLHDITKNFEVQEHLNTFGRFGIILSDIEMNSEKLWHQISGAAYIQNVLNITDSDILDAVRYHTTAKADMPLISKILYLADFTSLDREYDDIEVIRGLVNESLQGAYEYALRYTVMDLANRHLAIHPDTIDAYNETMLKRS